MSGIDFDQFFRKAFGKDDEATFCPFEYQQRLACGERAERNDRDWLASGTDCKSRLIDIPTGLGKTAAVVAWLPKVGDDL